MDSKRPSSSRANSEEPTDGSREQQGNSSDSEEPGANVTMALNPESSDAILNQLILAVSQASSRGNALGQPAQGGVTVPEQNTAQSFDQQLTMLLAANNAGLPGLAPSGLAPPTVNSAAYPAVSANDAMQAAAYLLAAAANTNPLQAPPPPQQQPQRRPFFQPRLPP